MSPLFKPGVFRMLGLATLCLTLACCTQADAAKRTSKRPLTKPKFDPSAEKVELFKGMKNGKLSVRMIAKNSKGGRILVENKTGQPLTVLLPKAIVGVQVLKQIGMGGGGIGGGLGGGLGGGGYGGGQGGLGGGGQQPLGGGFGGGGGGLGGGGGGYGGGGFGGGGGQQGGGFFSVPAKRVVAVPFRSVCLAHGKPDPTPRANYRLVKVEDYTKDETLQELITVIGTRKIDSMVAQAAAWNLTDKMSWRTLAMKKRKRLGGVGPVPYFARGHIFAAQRLVAHARTQAAKRKKNDQETKPTKPTTPRSVRSRVTRRRRARR